MNRARRRKLRRARRRREIRHECAFLVSKFEEMVARTYDVTYPPLPRTYCVSKTGERVAIADENGRIILPET